MPPEDFSQYVAALGRGQGRSSALSRDEARRAFASVLAGEVDPHQFGAFLMLLRYRGEDADEMTGLVEAAQPTLPPVPDAALDWPIYGAGRTRDAPWFPLAALALGQAAVRILMHGSNAFSSGQSTQDGLASIGLAPARDCEQAATSLDRIGFAYLPIEVLSPEIARLLALRRLFGLRSPVNTVARFLDPARAPAGVDGVFHPAHIDVHLRVAERLNRNRLLVLKGGGGEAERIPGKPGLAHFWVAGVGRSELILLPDVDFAPNPCATDDRELLAKVWHGEALPARAIATIHATIALAMLATGHPADVNAVQRDAERIWQARRR